MAKKQGSDVLRKILTVLAIIATASSLCWGLVEYGKSEQKKVNKVDTNSEGIARVVNRVDKLEKNMDKKFEKLHDKMDDFLSDDKTITLKKKIKGALSTNG